MKFLHVLKRKKFLFINIFLFSYILINFFDGDRGLFSYLDKKKQKENLIVKKESLIKNLDILENKNKLLTESINFDFLDMLIREKLKFGHPNEVVIKLNE
tara:strand:+ start:1064 stop:1363 length:300 start_codon:yes stop_codon:yes gene_type:complete